MRTRLALSVAIALAGLPAGTPAQAMVIAKCANSGIAGSASVDPIVSRGMPVSAHQHDFLGNKALLTLPNRERATYDQLVNQPTSCNIATDSAAYWMPSLYVAGVQLPPLRAEAYYRSWTHSVIDPGNTTRPFAADTRMVAGNPVATSAAEMDVEHIWWSCGLLSSKPGKTFHFATPADADCASATGTVGLTIEYDFPTCWDGLLNDHTVDGDTSDFNGKPGAAIVQHYAYEAAESCPAAFPIHVPALAINVSYRYAGNGLDVLLSSGPGYTAHADFLNAWPVDVMARMVDTCIDTPVTEAQLHQGDNVALCGPPPFATPIPAAPSSLTAVPKSASVIRLSWDATKEALAYKVWRSRVRDGAYTLVASTSTTGYRDAGLRPNTAYFYVVQPVNGDGNSSNSAQTSASTFRWAPRPTS